MTNYVAIEGYVKEVRIDQNGRYMNVRISVPDGQDQQGNKRYSPATVHISCSQNGTLPTVQAGQILLGVGGRYRKFKGQDGAWYDQIAFWENQIWVKGEPKQQDDGWGNGYQNQPQNNYGGGLNDDNIPF